MILFYFSDHAAINILHINCRSLKKNFGSIKGLFNFISFPLFAIAVTETWLTEHLQDAYRLPGYNFVSNARIGKTGGGVDIF
jgi:hypothetical protein